MHNFNRAEDSIFQDKTDMHFNATRVLIAGIYIYIYMDSAFNNYTSLHIHIMCVGKGGVNLPC